MISKTVAIVAAALNRSPSWNGIGTALGWATRFLATASATTVLVSLRPRPLPRRVRFQRDLLFERSKRFKRGLEILEKNPEARLEGYTADEQLLILVARTKRRFPSLDVDAFGHMLADAYNACAPVIPAPRVDLPTDDIVAAWSQPEAKQLWSRWWLANTRRQDAPSNQGAKAVAVHTAAMRRGPHVISGWDAARNGGPLLELLTRYSHEEARGGDPALVVKTYSPVTRLIGPLLRGLSEMAMETCVGIVKTLAEMYPELPIGRWVAIDGTAIPAWTPQARNLSEQAEKRVGERAPEADYRAYVKTIDGLVDADRVPKKLRVLVKSWRGFLFIVISEYVTGLPLTGLLCRAAEYEPRMLDQLLERLFTLWPSIPLEAVVGDKLFDTQPAHAITEVRFGCHLVAHRRPSHSKKGGVIFDKKSRYRGLVGRINGNGHAWCREHEAWARFDGTDVPERGEFDPGEPTDSREYERHARRFRSRWTCVEGSHRLSAPTESLWSALPYFPLHPIGRPDLFAWRIALLARRNIGEAVWSTLKVGFKLGNSGSARPRVADRGTYEGLIWIALVTRSLLTLANERNRRRDG
jgi:hypothetical protein